MPWGRTVGHNRKRPLAYPDEILAAVDLALKKDPPKDEISAGQLASKVMEFIPIPKEQITLFIQKRMTTEQRKERNITEPRQYFGAADTKR